MTTITNRKSGSMLLRFTLILFLTILLCSCNDGGDNKAVDIMLKPVSLTFKAISADPQTVEVAAAGAEWIVINPAEKWIGTSREGNILIVSMLEDNPDEGSRMAGIIVKSGNSSSTLLVTQQGRSEEDGGNETVDVVFTAAAGVYLGKNENLTGGFEIELLNDGETFRMEAFSDIFALPQKFIPAEGEYSADSSGRLYTYTPGKSGNGQNEGTVLTSNGKTVLITEGYVKIEYTDGSYTIQGSVSGRDILSNTKADVEFIYTGPITFNYIGEALDYIDYSDFEMCSYYGDFYTNDGSTGQYDLYFSGEIYNTAYWDGFAVKELFSSMAADPDNAKPDEGVYRFRNTRTPFTMTAGYLDSDTPKMAYAYKSYFGVVTEATLGEYGTLIIEKNGGDYTLTGYFAGMNTLSKTTQSIAFRYSGPLPTENAIPERAEDSYTVALTEGDSYFFGNYYETGSHRFGLDLYDKNEEYMVSLDLCTPSSSVYNNLPAGEYSPSREYSAFTYVPGQFYNLSGAEPTSFYVLKTDGSYSIAVTIDTGAVKVEKSGSDSYSISGTVEGTSVTDQKRVTVSFSYSGKLKYTDKSN